MKMKKSMRMSIPRRAVRRGFTLLEVIVVVTIIALLATLVAPRLLGNVDKAKQKKATAEIETIHQQVSMWALDNNSTSVPDDFELSWLTEGKNATLSPDDLIDPWENAYQIEFDESTKDGFYIICFGGDGQAGGEDMDADLMSE